MPNDQSKHSSVASTTLSDHSSRKRQTIRDHRHGFHHETTTVTVDESVHEEDGSDNEEKEKNIEEYICQLLNQRTASQRRDKSCVPSH